MLNSRSNIGEFQGFFQSMWYLYILSFKKIASKWDYIVLFEKQCVDTL